CPTPGTGSWRRIHRPPSSWLQISSPSRLGLQTDCGVFSWSASEFSIRVRGDSGPSRVLGPRGNHTNCTLNDCALSPGARPLFESVVVVYTVLETCKEALLCLFF